jgi:hypothetical protein
MVGLMAWRGCICGDGVDVCAAPRFELQPFVQRSFLVTPVLALRIVN